MSHKQNITFLHRKHKDDKYANTDKIVNLLKRFCSLLFMELLSITNTSLLLSNVEKSIIVIQKYKLCLTSIKIKTSKTVDLHQPT